MKRVTSREWYQRGFFDGARQMRKAFGGCDKCYGKGYSTQQLGGAYGVTDFGPLKEVQVHGPRPVMNFCTCERGKQLKKLVEPKNPVAYDKSNRHLQ